MIFDREQLKEVLKKKDVKDVDALNSLLSQISGEVIETLLEGEMTYQLGYEKHDCQTKETENSRNGFGRKSLKSHFGDVVIKTPRDRKSEFQPQVVKKRQLDICGLEEKIISLYAKGMSTRDIHTHIKSIYGYEVSAEKVSTITDQVMEKAQEWQNRLLEPIYGVVFLDAMFAKMRCEDRIVRNVAIYNIIGISMEGKKECLGLWVCQSESSKFWLSVLNELKNRGVKDVLIFSVDNLNGISQSISAVYPGAEIQKCVVHQIRSSLNAVPSKHRKQLADDLKKIYKAATEEQAITALEELEKEWKQYPTVAKAWKNNWTELSTFLKYPGEMRKLIYTTNTIESFHRSLRRRIKTKAQFPSKEAMVKMLYLAIDETSGKWTRPVAGWKEIYQQLAIYFEERIQKL